MMGAPQDATRATIVPRQFESTR